MDKECLVSQEGTVFKSISNLISNVGLFGFVFSRRGFSV